jgi:hypothetical protein
MNPHGTYLEDLYHHVGSGNHQTLNGQGRIWLRPQDRDVMTNDFATVDMTRLRAQP